MRFFVAVLLVGLPADASADYYPNNPFATANPNHTKSTAIFATTIFSALKENYRKNKSCTLAYDTTDDVSSEQQRRVLLALATAWTDCAIGIEPVSQPAANAAISMALYECSRLRKFGYETASAHSTACNPYWLIYGNP